MRPVFVAALAVLIFATAIACGDDDDSATLPPATSSESATPDESFKGLSREALRTFLSSDGLDGRAGALTDPIECAELPEEGVDGDFCIVEPSTYTPALALIIVADVEDREEEAWQVRVVLEDGEWRVIEAVKLGTD